MKTKYPIAFISNSCSSLISAKTQLGKLLHEFLMGWQMQSQKQNWRHIEIVLLLM